MIKFIEMISSSFEIKNVVKRLRGEDELYKVAIHTLTPKGSAKNNFTFQAPMHHV
jgi:hypothetical protein